jgi:pyruvate dehydrogenase E2 component (dihydrolipoamide acetyltransferase)
LNQGLTKKDIICREFQIKKFNVKKIVPTVTMSININIDNMLKKRNEINKSSSSHITIYHCVIKAISDTIINYPLLYSVFYRKKIIMNKSLNINVPVSIDNHVEYIVLRKPDEKTFEEISAEMQKGMADIKAGSNLLMQSLEDLYRLNKLQKIIYTIKNYKNPVYFLDKYYGHFPVSNFGSFNVDSGATVLSQPIVAGIAVGRTGKVTGLSGGNIIQNNILPVTLSFDHRVMDGAYAGNFLNDLRKYMENIFLIL